MLCICNVCVNCTCFEDSCKWNLFAGFVYVDVPHFHVFCIAACLLVCRLSCECFKMQSVSIKSEWQCLRWFNFWYFSKKGKKNQETISFATPILKQILEALFCSITVSCDSGTNSASEDACCSFPHHSVHFSSCTKGRGTVLTLF